jgi:integrase
MGMKEKGFKQLPDGGWEAAVWDGRTNRNIRKRFPNKSQAVAWRTELKHLQLHDELGLGRKERITFQEAADEFIRWSKTNLRPSTATQDEQIMGMFKAYPAFANKRLDQVTTSEIELFKQNRVQMKSRQGNRNHERLVSTRAVDLEIGRLKRLFNVRIALGLFTKKNPAIGVKLFNDKSERVRYLSVAEEKALLAACPPYLKKIVQFGYLTGLRRGELLGLKPRRINLDVPTVFIPAPKAKGKKDRYVPLNDSAVAILEACNLKDPDAYVFGNSKGEFQKNLERMWRKALKKSDVKDFRFHDLRHTYASRLAMKGTDLLVLRDLLGHTDIKMTLRYAHLAPTKMLEAVKMLDLDFQNTCNADESHSEVDS